MFVQVDIEIKNVVADLRGDLHSSCGRLLQVDIEMKVKLPSFPAVDYDIQ